MADDQASVTEATFDKNAVLTDAALRDVSALSESDIQAFLDETPWGHASVLATYEEDGKSAATMIYEAAYKHRINPLELLVRLQMEQSLVYKKTASAESIALAFGCGCPHSPVCSPAYEGFANQVDCAAGTLSRSMDRAVTEKGTASGWKKGEEKRTQDGVSVVPRNAATAALYTYTPWVGEAGGGKKGVGGVSLHHQVWTRFANAIGYTGASSGASDDTGTEVVLEPGPSTEPGSTDAERSENAADAGSAAPQPSEPSPTPPTKPSAPPTGQEDDYEDEADGRDTADDGADDDDILAEGNVPPVTELPPPQSSGTRGKRAADDLEDDTEELRPRRQRPVASSGCSSSPAPSGDNVVLATFAAAGAMLLVTRRRRP